MNAHPYLFPCCVFRVVVRPKKGHESSPHNGIRIKGRGFSTDVEERDTID
jgi:hypothetical protein